MRKLFLSMAAVATLLASCSKDDGLIGVSKSQVTFTVSSPEMATRYGEGEKATTLYYAVYDAVEGGLVEGLSQLAGEDFTGGEKQVTINLVEGRTYSIIFYAQNAAETPYYVNWQSQVLYIPEPAKLLSNKETYDAFYAHEDNLKIGNAAINKTITLRRPFAQLNILTSQNDIDLAKKAGIEVKNTAVTVKKIYTQMNLMNDAVVKESETAVTFGLNTPADGTYTIDGTDYKWLAMNYLLVNEQKMVDVEFTMEDTTVAAGQDNMLLRKYGSIHVERNHRTNIYGALITNPAIFNVKIDEEFFKPDHNVNGGEQYTTTVATADELQKAIDNAKVGERTIIKFDGDIDATTTRAATNAAAEIWVAQKDGVQIVIDGCGHEFNGSFKVHGNSGYRNATLDFVNINFKTSTSDLNFIYAKDFGGSKRYSQNITVSDCTFEAVNNPIDVVGVQVNASKNLHIINCTAKNMHSLLQAQSCDDKIQVENVTIENCSEGGVAFGNAAYPTIKNSTITNAADYGIRADGDASRGNLVIENVNISGTNVPVVVRRVTTAYNVALKGQNTLKATGLYDVVFTNGNNKEEYAKPTGKWSITGAEGLNVYPTALEEGYNASSSEQLSQAIAAGATTVNLEEGTYIIPDAAKGKTLTIVGTGDPEDTKIATQDDGSYEGCDYSLDGSTVVFENVSINTDSSTYTGYARMNGTYKNCIINGTYTLYGNSVFEDCTFNVSGDVYNIWTWGAPTATFTRCTFNCDGKAMLLYGTANTKLTMNDCIFNDKGGLTDLKAAIEIGNDYDKSYELIVNNATVNGFEINDKGINTGTTLWANKNSMGTDKLNVVVDGVDVY